MPSVPLIRLLTALIVLPLGMAAAHGQDGRAQIAQALRLKTQSRYTQALSCCESALTLAHKAKDRLGAAGVLALRAQIENDLNQTDRALRDDQAALALFEVAGDMGGQADVLSALGDIYFSLSHYAESLDRYGWSLATSQEAADVRRQGNALSGLANVLDALGQSEPARIDYTQALLMQRQAHDDYGAAKTLNNLGALSADSGQWGAALARYRQALPLFQRLNQSGYGRTLSNVGNIYLAQGQDLRALGYYRRALPVQLQIEDRYGAGKTLTNIGNAYEDLKKYDLAVDTYQQALALQRITGDQQGEATTLDDLMQLWQDRKEPVPAVFYGKQAVNAYQRIRRSLRTLTKGTQKAYLAAHEDTYRALADLLIAQGRLPEAQQVLGLLKEEEYFQFVRRDPQAADAGAAPELSATQWEQRYQAISDQVIALGQEKASLDALPSLTPAQEQREAALESDLKAAQRHVKSFLAEIEAHSAGSSTRVTEIKEAQALMQDLRALGPGTVMLYTVVGADNYRVILMTADARKAAQADPPVTAEELNKKVLAFREALQDPHSDPRPQAQALYQILLGPIEKDLTQAGAKTIMWSLDGDLRYLPVAALYDGKQYLVERFQNVLFTPASEAHLRDTPQPHWTGLGMGVSKPHTFEDPDSQQKLNFVALPSVPVELHGIIRDTQSQTTSTGILSGSVLLDEDFKLAAMKAALRRHDPVVHIASHFRFQTGDDEHSFLLLGDGTPLTLADIEEETNLFEGVDLLTLSACETGLGDTGTDGREVDGLGILAQRQGAKAVIATLWSVADESTRRLMEQFYLNRQNQTNMTKAAALQQAQLALLSGKIKPTDPTVLFLDPKANFSHPYYWAPFILIGNWQ